MLQKLWACRFECPDDASLEAIHGLHSILQRRFETQRSDGLMLKCFVCSFARECGVFLDLEEPTGDRLWIKKEGSGLVGVFAKFQNHDELLHPLLSDVFALWKNSDDLFDVRRWLPLLVYTVSPEIVLQTKTGSD